jgi:hypothetical protein
MISRRTPSPGCHCSNSAARFILSRIRKRKGVVRVRARNGKYSVNGILSDIPDSAYRKFKYGKERSPRGLECECTQKERSTSITKQLDFQYPFCRETSCNRVLERFLLVE